MDGTLMSMLHGNLNALSDKSFGILKSYYATGSLSLLEQNLLQNEITEHLAMSKDVLFTKLKDLNISSRDHIAWVLQTHEGWKPTTLTATGKPVIDEVILKGDWHPDSDTLLAMSDDQQDIGNDIRRRERVAQACYESISHPPPLLNCHDHASMQPQTSKPCPSPSESQFRKLFTASPGMVMCGADLSGIELRLLGHYLSRYSTYFSDNLLNDDIHQVNADKIGISRRQVKTVTYAFLYGAGSEKIGHSFDPQLSTKQAKIKGRKFRKHSLQLSLALINSYQRSKPKVRAARSMQLMADQSLLVVLTSH